MSLSADSKSITLLKWVERDAMQITLDIAKAIYRKAIDARPHDREGETWWDEVSRTKFAT